MKPLITFFAILFCSLVVAQNNDQNIDWRNMTPEQRKDLIHKMSPEEKRLMFRKFRENMMIEELKVEPSVQDKFKEIYNLYATDQRSIKDKFHHQQKLENLSAKQAKEELDKSFEVAQQLLNSRKEFTKKFLEILSPQQVIQMYHIEGRARSEMLESRSKGPKMEPPKPKN